MTPNWKKWLGRQNKTLNVILKGWDLFRNCKVKGYIVIKRLRAAAVKAVSPKVLSLVLVGRIRRWVSEDQREGATEV